MTHQVIHTKLLETKETEAETVIEARNEKKTTAVLHRSAEVAVEAEIEVDAPTVDRTQETKGIVVKVMTLMSDDTSLIIATRGDNLIV